MIILPEGTRLQAKQCIHTSIQEGDICFIKGVVRHPSKVIYMICNVLSPEKNRIYETNIDYYASNETIESEFSILNIKGDDIMLKFNGTSQQQEGLFREFMQVKELVQAAATIVQNEGTTITDQNMRDFKDMITDIKDKLISLGFRTSCLFSPVIDTQPSPTQKTAQPQSDAPTKKGGKITIYTDGGCRGNQNKENIGSWAYKLEYAGNTKKDGGVVRNTTNNIMELTSVIKALEALKSFDIPVVVHLDSQYVCDGITKWIDNWKRNGWRTANKKPVLNVELWRQLDELRNKFKDIEFVKVAGHAGVQGNEEVDAYLNSLMDQA